MAYNEDLAFRVREALALHSGVTERKMFGGLAFMVNGHMCCGVMGDELMIRVGPAQHEAALRLPHARTMDFTGKPMRGMIYVDADGTAGNELAEWVGRGLAFVDSLPPK
ncbi:MAG: TfoX/Sxy family protein [Anaerolineae bacterium]|uniref:TfoX/Sxy family protein n=1 Tax=Promineifilum sp. TaxID=2664178 RepID=UPI001D6523C6|nr:TfoX/Sxy family protein [Anaerolineales bacterium]MCB8934351.1 TfoX/Sxy family protein [Promineifilum sp.]MCO5180322.1 TfoX/Sxy family protein [Promineifilum sp.]MCW5847312.1 TfoX/Sxy family protein [Anaerolineae bacterium]